jgi:hypothetical protein
MADSRSEPTPKGLDPRGRRLWKQVTSAYKLRLDELILLESACKTLDLIVHLEAAMAGQPLTTKGSMGQEREHPLLSEARMQRVYLNRTLAQLSLPDLVDGVLGPRNQHRDAAQSRWAKAHGGGQS